MLTIFSLSAQPSSELPDFDWADQIIKKGAHVAGYALLALSYWWALGLQREKRWLAWGMAVLFAVTDEFHQSFVPGRFPSIWDVLVFDNFGALSALWLMSLHKTQRSDSLGPIVESTRAKS